MKTLLDEFHTSFLHAAVYADGVLRVVVAEGFRAPEPEDLIVAGHVFDDTFAICTSKESRLIEVQFKRPIAWQVVDESFTAANDYELRDDNCTLQVLTRSPYLDYVRANHGWFEDIRGSGKHYRIWTENDVVDVVGCEPPRVCRTVANDHQQAPSSGTFE